MHMLLDRVLLEKEDVWLWFMDLVMLPSQTLSTNRQYLADFKSFDGFLSVPE